MLTTLHATAALVAVLAQSCYASCPMRGCWSDPSRGVLHELSLNSTAAQIDWGIENTSSIGNLSCTERCSDRCFPGSFPYAPCTPGSDLRCSWPGELVDMGISNATWPVVVGARTIYFSSEGSIYSLTWDGVVVQPDHVCGSPGTPGFVDGVGMDARLSLSMGGMDHAGGSLYACDTGNSAIRSINLTTGSVATLFNASHGLVSPLDIALGPDGMAYVVDPGAYVIHRFSLGVPGVLEVFGGVPGEYGIGEGPLSIVRFWDLSSIEVIGSVVLVTEYTQCTVRSIDIASRVVRDLVGESNVCDDVCSGGDGPPSPGRLCRPNYIRRWGETDVVYVGEWFPTVGFSNMRSINTTTMVVEDLGSQASPPFHFAAGPDLQFVARGGDTLGIEPMPCDPGLVIENSSLFDCRENLTTAESCPGESLTPGCDEGCFGGMCDQHCSVSCEVGGHYILRHCTEWEDITCGALSTAVVVGGSTLMPGDLQSSGRVDSPKSMVHVNVSLAYVADTANQRILGFDPARNRLWMFSGVSESPQWQDGASPMYNQPSQMFLHPDGDSLVVLDVGNYAVRRVFLLDGSATTIAGTPQSAGYSDGGVGAGKLGTISDMIPGVDGETVYLSDNTVFAVRSFNLTTGYITTICGGGIQIMNGDCSSSAMIGIIRGMAMDPSGDGRFLYMLTQSEDPTTFQMGTYLQYIDMNFMYTGTLDSQIQGGGNFWLRFIGGQLSTWAQDPGGGNVNGRVVALTIDSGQGMNQDLNALSTLMEYPGPFNGSTLPQIWMPPCLSPDMQYYTTMAGSPYAEPFNAPPMVWRNHLPCDESSIVPGVSVMQSCTPHFSTRPCRREEPLFPSATPPPVVGINDTWVDNDPIYHLPSNEVWRSTTISRSDHQYYNLAWFCDSRAGPDINTTAALEATALGSTGLGPIHTIHTSVNGSLVFGQREGLWELDLESNSATVYHALRSPELVGYPLLTRRFDEAGAVVAGTLVLDMETEDIIAGSTTPGYEVGIGGQARFSRITNAHYVGSFPQDPGGPFLVLEDRSIATGTYWRPMDPVEGRVGGALLSFEGYMITMTSFLVDPEDGTMVYACTGSRLLLLRIRDPEVWDLLVPQQGGFEAGDRLLVGLPLGAPSPSVVDYPLNGMPGPGYPMSGVEELSMSPCHRFIYMVSFSRGRRDVLRYHIPSGNVMWIPDFPNVPVSDLAFRGVAIAGSGASHRHIGIVSGSCGLTIVERGCDVGMGFTGSHPYAGEVVCTDCLDWEYSAYMDHDCRNLTLECPEGTLADGNNTRGSTVTCVPCPWGFACPQRHVSINYYWFPQPWMLSWITSCGPGTYGYGDNNSTHTASCQPCPAGYACTGTSSLDGNETSFVPVWNQSGVVPWTMECGEGTYPTGSNGPTTTATCVPCPPLSRCPPTSADELGVFPHPPTIIPWVLSCPPGTLPVGSEGSAYCSPCGVPHVAPYSCPDAHNATPNANGTLAPFLDVTPPIPWVLWCDGGSLFRGSNTNLTSAWCAPCPERTACFAGNDTGYDGDPWVESCGVGSYAEGVNTNSSIVSCVGCPPVGAGCPGGAVEDALLYAWVGSCPPGTSYESGWNTLDHLNPVVCGVCPWNMSCPEATPVDNTTANQTGRGENTTTYMVPWVWVCPPGTYGVGSNTELVSARCASPCTPQRACLGTEARVVDGDAEDGDGYEVSFIWDGRSPWNLQCPPGSYPSSNNTDRSLAECSPCPDGYACPEWSYADPITGLFHNRSTLIIRHLTDCPQEGQVVVGTSNTSVGQCVVPTPAPTPAPTPVPTPAPTPAPTSLGDRSFVLQVGLGGGVDAPTIRSLVMAESLPRGPYASRYDVGISKMLGGYPTSISTLAYDSGAFLSVTSFVTVRIEDAAAMLELGASRISSSSVASQMALEVGTIGITADVVEPPPDVAVGRWFVEVLGEGGYHAMSGARGRGCASPLLTLIALACIGWTLYH